MHKVRNWGITRYIIEISSGNMKIHGGFSNKITNLKRKCNECWRHQNYSGPTTYEAKYILEKKHTLIYVYNMGFI